MPAFDLSKPEILNFFAEVYEKTNTLRVRWNVLNKDKIKESARFTGNEKGYTESDVSKFVLEAGMATTARDNINAHYNRMKIPIPPYIPGIKDLRKSETIINLGLGDAKEDPRLVRPDNDFSFDPIMRPVPHEQSKKIYKGLPEYGRVEYLKERNHIKPEDKYYFQESMGWNGWRLKDSYFSKFAPEYPRRGMLRKSLVSRSGFQADPSHYPLTSTALLEGRQTVLSSNI